MPTYQYSCTDCGHFFETFQSFTDDSLTVCPECEGRLRKVFNAVGVVFKGSGFYRNDSREQKSGANGGSSTSTKDSSEKSSSESKPAAKSEGTSGGTSGGSSSGKPASTSGSSSGSAAAAPA
ncbi:MAG: FmdB family zinc ribbon protein [Marmoricola sp.]